MSDGIKNHQVLISVGSGGVGKTTLSAGLGLAESLKGRRVLVLTIDPAQRLADALGLINASENMKSDDHLVVKWENGGALYAAMLDSPTTFLNFVRQFSQNPEATEKLFKNRLFQQLMTTLSGSQEFTALERLLRSVESDQYDLIILDTPPAQHALEFIRAPERIFKLFQASMTFFKKDPQSPWQRLFQQGTQSLLAVLEKITGGNFVHELIDFFLAAHSFQEAIAQRSLAVHRLLLNPSTGFLLVTTWDEAKIHEARQLSTELQHMNHHMCAILWNRTLPDWYFSLEEDLRQNPQMLFEKIACENKEKPPGIDPKILQLFVDLIQYNREREQKYRQLMKDWPDQKVVQICLPEQSESLDGLEGLKRLEPWLKSF